MQTTIRGASSIASKSYIWRTRSILTTTSCRYVSLSSRVPCPCRLMDDDHPLSLRPPPAHPGRWSCAPPTGRNAGSPGAVAGSRTASSPAPAAACFARTRRRRCRWGERPPPSRWRRPWRRGRGAQRLRLCAACGSHSSSSTFLVAGDGEDGMEGAVCDERLLAGSAGAERGNGDVHPSCCRIYIYTQYPHGPAGLSEATSSCSYSTWLMWREREINGGEKWMLSCGRVDNHRLLILGNWIILRGHNLSQRSKDEDLCKGYPSY